MRNVLLDFGGFYCSQHSDMVDWAVQMHYTDENDVEMEIPDTVNWSKLYKTYANEWLDKFEEYLCDETGKKVTLEFVDLDSPKYYNYRTDRIELLIDHRSAGIILDYAFREVEFDKYIREETKNRDGYVSFYTYSEVMQDKDNIAIAFALEYMSELFQENDNSMYEINAFEIVAQNI